MTSDTPYANHRIVTSRPTLLALASALAAVAACSKSVPSDGSIDLSPASDAQVRAEPEPVGAGFKPIPASCGEPVVRLFSQPRDQYQSARADGFVVAFVRDNPEFGQDGIHYAEAELGDRKMLLARCPDAETANRMARKARERDKTMSCVPLCGYASSGWTHAVRRVPAH